MGTDLVHKLKLDHVTDLLVATDVKEINLKHPGIFFEKLDVTDKNALEELIKKYQIDTVYHMAGLLSVGGEKNPDAAWEVNVGGLRNTLQIASQYKIKVFWPSSIAAFGPTTPKVNTPQHTILEPNTIYGVTKVTGELLCQYYFNRYGVDVRSLRYPGLIAWKAEPGDGTTEYAVHIFYEAIKTGKYDCFLDKDTVLPMMYIDDAIEGTITLMNTQANKLSIRTSYNFSALSFSPADLVKEIQKIQPEFVCKYSPDSRQGIADSWPKIIDDSQLRNDVEWRPKYTLDKLAITMYENIKNKIKGGEGK